MLSLCLMPWVGVAKFTWGVHSRGVYRLGGIGECRREELGNKKYREKQASLCVLFYQMDQILLVAKMHLEAMGIEQHAFTRSIRFLTLISHRMLCLGKMLILIQQV